MNYINWTGLTRAWTFGKDDSPESVRTVYLGNTLASSHGCHFAISIRRNSSVRPRSSHPDTISGCATLIDVYKYKPLSHAHSCNCQLFSNAYICITLPHKARGQVVILAPFHIMPTIGWPSLDSFILAPLSDRDLANRSKDSSGHYCGVLCGHPIPERKWTVWFSFFTLSITRSSWYNQSNLDPQK